MVVGGTVRREGEGGKGEKRERREEEGREREPGKAKSKPQPQTLKNLGVQSMAAPPVPTIRPRPIATRATYNQGGRGDPLHCES